MGLRTSLTVEFDGGRAGQQTYRDFANRFGDTEQNNEDGVLTVTWSDASDALVDAAVDGFKEGDTILGVILNKEE